LKRRSLPCSFASPPLAVSLVVVASLSLASPTLAQSTYDFEGLSFEEGHLIGQDGWLPTVADNPGLFAQEGIGWNDSIVIDMPFGFTGIAGRLFDGTFGHPPLTGSETSMRFEVDVRADWTAGFNAFAGFAPWADLDSDMFVDYPAEIGPLFGFTHNAGVDVPNFYLGSSASGATFAVAAAPISVDKGDWLRIRLVMNLAANGGDGAGELQYRNLTDDDLIFRPTGISGFDLGLLGGPSPSAWNGVVVRLDNSVQLDNVTVPEPSVGLGLFVGGGWIVAVARRRSHSRS
jgi:hypothetical protein